jgi:hypothetical protein
VTELKKDERIHVITNFPTKDFCSLIHFVAQFETSKTFPKKSKLSPKMAVV